MSVWYDEEGVHFLTVGKLTGEVVDLGTHRAWTVWSRTAGEPGESLVMSEKFLGPVEDAKAKVSALLGGEYVGGLELGIDAEVLVFLRNALWNYKGGSLRLKSLRDSLGHAEEAAGRLRDLHDRVATGDPDATGAIEALHEWVQENCPEFLPQVIYLQTVALFEQRA
jgi:hypothetical protein